jgi:DNA helicase HerA-like ATPase
MNVLAADKLMLNPKLYSTFLLWLLSELYAQLPEVGDMDLPKLVFFFDEAHMLFDETSKALVDKIEQVVRLIRSKGVGVYFITQSPTDIPEDILGQLGNRVQHALRAFSPKDQKAVKTAAETFRENPAFKTADAIMELGTGEALVSFLDEKGAPSIVERAKILFPLSQIGAVTEGQRGQIINQSRLYGKYDKIVDRESAFEVLMEEAEAALKAEQEAAEAEAQEKAAKEEAKSRKSSGGNTLLKGIFGAVVGAVVTSVTSSIGNEVSKKVTGKKSKTTTKDIAGKALGSAARTATKQLTRSVLGNLIK